MRGRGHLLRLELNTLGDVPVAELFAVTGNDNLDRGRVDGVDMVCRHLRNHVVKSQPKFAH